MLTDTSVTLSPPAESETAPLVVHHLISRQAPLGLLSHQQQQSFDARLVSTPPFLSAVLSAHKRRTDVHDRIREVMAPLRDVGDTPVVVMAAGTPAVIDKYTACSLESPSTHQELQTQLVLLQLLAGFRHLFLSQRSRISRNHSPSVELRASVSVSPAALQVAVLTGDGCQGCLQERAN
jgi:hypothetical protein